MHRLLLCALLCVLPLAACKRRANAPAAAELPAAPPNPEVDLKALNEATRAYFMGELKEPDSLEALVKAGFLQRLPTAPPGQKYVLSPDRKSVRLVAQ